MAQLHMSKPEHIGAVGIMHGVEASVNLKPCKRFEAYLLGSIKQLPA